MPICAGEYLGTYYQCEERTLELQVKETTCDLDVSIIIVQTLNVPRLS